MNILNRLLCPKIEITTKDIFTIITIKDTISLEEYNKRLSKSLFKPLLQKINTKHITDKNSTNISPKNIILVKHKEITYLITITNKTYHISSIKKDTITEETSLSIDFNTYEYQISTSTTELDNNKKDIKTYTKNDTETSIPKKQALQLITNMLTNIGKIPGIYEYLRITEFFQALHIISDEEFYPVTNNDIITLSWPRRYGQTNINKKQRCTLDIILNSTREKIGEITFSYFHNNHSSYSGNVGYSIHPDFQKNHYATQALALLKEMLKQNMYPGNKDLYISTTPSNIYSQKVALNNGGTLYYEGEVPPNDPLSRHSGITEVQIYRIKL